MLDLEVGKVPVSFREDKDGLFGKMRQVPPVFGPVHDRGSVAEALGLNAVEIEPDFPIQTVSTGLPYASVPIRRLRALQSLHFDLQKADNYLRGQATEMLAFYCITRDTGDSLRRFGKSCWPRSSTFLALSTGHSQSPEPPLTSPALAEYCLAAQNKLQVNRDGRHHTPNSPQL